MTLSVTCLFTVTTTLTTLVLPTLMCRSDAYARAGSLALVSVLSITATPVPTVHTVLRSEQQPRLLLWQCVRAVVSNSLSLITKSRRQQS